MEKLRCEWCPADNPLYCNYHDHEWGQPVHDDRLLFELLTLEGAQAGLSWATVLKKREGYRKAFANFEVEKVARFSDKKQEILRNNPAIIRNRLKIASTVSNAQAFIRVQQEFGSFDAYLWQWVNGKPIVNHWRSIDELPANTELSDQLSKDLKKRGFRFVGSTICYAFMQATGLVSDHTKQCYLA